MAEIIAFPMSKSDGFIRRVVKTLAPLTEEQRRDVWNGRKNTTLRRLQANGVAKLDAASEVENLLREVKRRLRRRELDQERARAKRAARLRVVEADQLDLFGRTGTALPHALAISRLEGDADATAP